MGFGVDTEFLGEVIDICKFAVMGSVEEAVDFVLELGTVEATQKDKSTNGVTLDVAVFVSEVGEQALITSLKIFDVVIEVASLLDGQKCNGTLLNFGSIWTGINLDDDIE